MTAPVRASTRPAPPPRISGRSPTPWAEGTSWTAPDDVPEDHETLHVYRLDRKPFTANVCGRGRRGAVERFAAYSLVEDTDTTGLRGLDAWLEWCLEQEAKG